MVSVCVCVITYVWPSMSPHTRRGQKTLSNQAFSSAFTWALGIPSGSSGLHSKLVSHLPGPRVRYCEQ